MSGFDTQLKSQELTFPLRQRGAELQANAVAGLGQIPQQQVEWAQQKAESDAKIQSFQVERQLQQQKLKEMQMLDAAGMSRLQVEQQRIANETMAEQARALRQQNDRQEQIGKEVSPQMEARSKMAAYWHTATGGPQGAAAMGLVPDETGIGYRKAKDKAESDAFVERTKSIFTGRNRNPEAEQIRAAGTVLHAVALRRKSLTEELSALPVDRNKWTELHKTEYTRIKSEIESIDNESAAVMQSLSKITGVPVGGGQPAVSGGKTYNLNSIMRMLDEGDQ